MNDPRLEHDKELFCKYNKRFKELWNVCEKFKDYLSGDHKKEAFWQRFLTDNLGILRTLCPGAQVISQAYVGGKKLDNSGGGVVDFLAHNQSNGETSLIEIKTPQTKLISNSGTPSQQLNMAISQALLQREQYKPNGNTLRDQLSIETHSIKSFIIIGMMPESKDKLVSFKRYINNLKDVRIVTFDELYEKCANHFGTC